MTKATPDPKTKKVVGETTQEVVTAAEKAAKEIGVSADDMTPPTNATLQVSPGQVKDFIENGSMALTPIQAKVIHKTARVKADSESREAVLSIVGGVSTEELKRALAVQTEQRQLIKEFIQNNLEEGTDYGKIHVVKNCPMETNKPGSCDRSYHYSKPILMKPGQEKIFSLFGITDELERDKEAYEMMPDVTGMVALKCVMYRGDKKIGEGRGAAVLTSERSDPNSTIKKAEKRARMDACLSLGFSAYFTQDLDDPEYKAQREMMLAKTAAEAERRDKDDLGLWKREPSDPMDNDERALLFATIKKAGYQEPDTMLELLAANGVDDPKTMTSGQVREMIRNIKIGNYVAIPVRTSDEPDNPDEVITDIDSQDTAQALDEATAALNIAAPEIDLVIDDDIKEYIETYINNMELTDWGMRWLYTKMFGKPFAKLDRLYDEEWRRAYNFITNIDDGSFTVPDQYFKKNTTLGLPDAREKAMPPESDDLGNVQKIIPGAQPFKETT